VPVDHARWAGEVDLVAIDHYPSTLDDAPAQSAFAADAARGWADAAGHADGQWLLMEHAPGSVTEQGVQRRKPPGAMARLALGHLARGSRGALYFQWRASRAGAEQWHTALVPHAGPDSRIFAEAVELGARLPALPEQPVAINPKIAIWYDEQCSWALQASHLPAPVDYQQTVERWHQALWRRGYPLDVVPPEADLTPYQLVIVPMAYLLGAGAADRLAGFVAGGGHLLVSYLSGLVDENAQVGLGGYPAALRELLGIRVEEFDPLPASRTQRLSTAAGEPYATATGWTERLRTVDARVDAHYPDGSAAVTSRAHGAGLARYLSCDLVPASLDQLLVAECATAGIMPVLPGLPDGVEAIRSRGALWLINHTDRPQLVAGHELAAGAVDVVPNG
jgi:beta-galactosidase